MVKTQGSFVMPCLQHSMDAGGVIGTIINSAKGAGNRSRVASSVQAYLTDSSIRFLRDVESLKYKPDTWGRMVL